MSQTGSFYVGRIVKSGDINQQRLVNAMKRATTTYSRDFAWTITDIIVHPKEGMPKYIFGRLSKYLPEGEVDVVDPENRSQDSRVEPNLLRASSPFIYIPEYSGIAFLHVWNQIEQRTFSARFRDVILETMDSDRLFIDLEVEPVSDVRQFVTKIRELQSITKIRASVRPPNPLFGPMWKRLMEYLAKRNADELIVEENATEQSPLRSNLPQLVSMVQSESEVLDKDSAQADITDAALLMAADGYGKGTVRGRKGSRVVTVSTSDTMINFRAEKDISPKELYEIAKEVFEGVSKRSKLRHK